MSHVNFYTHRQRDIGNNIKKYMSNLLNRLLMIGLFLFFSILIPGCETSKSIAKQFDPWMGHNKHELIMQWGPPTQTTSDGKDGEILIYATRVYHNLPNGSVSDYWNYRMMYADEIGRLYHWMYRRNPNPPERVDVRILTQ